MYKLSELADEEMLWIGKIDSRNPVILSKSDFLEEIEEHLGKPVYTTSTYQVQIDIMDMLKQMLYEEEGCMYEGWKEDFWNNVSEKDIQRLQSDVDKILVGINVSYSAEHRVDVDAVN